MVPRRLAIAVLVIATIASMSVTESSTASAAAAPKARTHELSIAGAPLEGTPVDLIGVGAGYLGVVRHDDRAVVVTSKDGSTWRVVEATGLGAVDWETFGAYPGGLNNVAHVLFTDGATVYFRAQTDVDYNRLGTTTLYASDASGRTWRPVTLPAPAGRAAFPITALRHGRTSYLGGAVYEPLSGQSYLDAAVWRSTGSAAWERIESSAFTGDGNQTIFTLASVADGIVAGGGDGSLIPTELCCYYPDGLALWHAGPSGKRWARAEVTQPAYRARFDTAAVVGVLGTGRDLVGVVSGNRAAVSRDAGRSWEVTRVPVPTGKHAVYAPRADAVLRVNGRQVGTTEPTGDCSDCTRGALAISSNGHSWTDVTPRFPCGQGIGRDSYGFVSRPAAVDGAVVALAGCGPALSSFNQTLLAASSDGGRRWRIHLLDPPVGAPIAAVAGHGRLATLAATVNRGEPGPVSAITVGP
jgi:hypothetical protein